MWNCLSISTHFSATVLLVNGFLAVKLLGGGVFLRKIEVYVHFRSEGFEANVHETNQIKPAEMSRNSFDLILLR